MGRAKLPPNNSQRFDFALMPPDRGFVRKTVISAIKKLGIRPVEGPAAVTVTWAEPNMRHSHARISEGIMAIYEVLVEQGILPREGSAKLDMCQRVNARSPHIELVIEGRVIDHLHSNAGRVAAPRERFPEVAL